MLNKGLQHYKKNADDINEELKNLPDDFLEEDKAREYLVRFLRANIGLTCYWMSGVDLFPFQEIAIKTMFKRDYTLGVWCKFPEEYVLTQRGYKKIKDIKIGDYVQSRYSLNKVLDTWENPKEEGLEIFFKNGINLKAKKGHRILTFNPENLSYEFKKIENINESDYFPIKLNASHWGDINILNEVPFVDIRRKKKKMYSERLKDSDDLFYTLGYFIGDGYFNNKSGCFSVACSSQPAADRLLRFFSSFSNKNNYQRNRGGCIEYTMTSVNFTHWLTQVGFEDFKKAPEKTIPNIFFSCSKEKVAQLLRGLFDADGFCCDTREKKRPHPLGLKSSSYELLKQVHVLLLNFGIYSSIYAEKNKLSFNLMISKKQSFFNFRKYINFESQHKKDNLEYFLNNTNFNTSNDFRIYGLEKEVVGEKNKVCSLGNRNEYEHLLSEKGKKFLKDYERDKFIFTKLKNTKPIYEKSIDITVDNEENYIGNGMVHHNSRGLSKCMNINDLCCSQTRGLVKAKDVVVGEKILSKNNFNRVLAKSKNPIQTTYKVITENGYKSEGLDYHRVLKINKEGCEEWAFSKDLRIGDLLLMRKNFPLPNQQKEVLFENLSYEDAVVNRNILLSQGVVCSTIKNGNSYSLINLKKDKDLFFCEKVKLIEKSEAETIDLTIENEHNYVSDGIINHNSFSTGVFAFLYAAFNPNSKIAIISKCVDENEYILTSKGLVQAKHIQVNDEVKSINNVNRVLDKWVNPVEEGRKIICKNGLQLTGKIGHKQLILNPQTLNLEWVKIEDINQEDAVPIQMGSNLFGNLSLLDDFNRFLEKQLPPELLKLNKTSMSYLLSELFDKNGDVIFSKEGDIEIVLNAPSFEMAKQIQIILFNYGIYSSIYTSQKACKVRITSIDDAILFNSEIGFQLERKKNKLQNFLDQQQNLRKNKFIIPFVGAYLKNKYKGFSHIKDNLSCDIITKIINEENNDPRGNNGRIDEEDRDKLKELIRYRFSKVKIIENVETKSVDITVDRESNYVVNGTISHNSFRQSREIFKKIEELANSKKGTLLAECLIGTPKHLNDEWSMQIGSSELKSLPLGDGCLQVFDSHILTKNSYTNFASILPDNLDTKIDHQEFTSPNTYVWSNGKFKKSDQQFYNGIRPTKKIETKKGLLIEATLNHKFKILNNLQIEWKESKNYKIGDSILIDKSVRWHEGDTKLTEDECYAFGAIIGDGCIRKTGNQLGFATCDKEIIDFLEEGTALEWYQSDKHHWYTKADKGDKLKYLGLFDYVDPESWETTNKYIPQPILNSSKPKVAAFIRGVMDTDGGVYSQTAKGGTSISVCFYNTSEKIVRQLQFLLLHFGIVANITKRQRTEDKRFGSVDWNPSWELHITGKDVLIFSQEIGFRLTRKKKALKDAIAKKKRWNSISDEQVPIDKNILVDFCKKNRVPQSQGNPYPSLIKASSINSKKYITKNLLEKFIEVYSYTEDPLLDSLRALIDPNIYFDTIYSIEDGKAPTADIHVPDGHEYTANGFFSHNSKLRGFRFNVLIVDELLLMPEKVINEVITPFLSTNKDPKKLHDVRELEDKLIKEGKMTEEERFEPEKNKMIGLSSASYTFEPLYKTYKEYITAITTGTEDGRQLKPDKSNALKGSYAVLQLSYDYAAKRCAGLYDEALLSKAKNQMSKQQFDREFGAQFTDESGGFFNMKTMNDCTVVDGEYPTTEIIGDPSEEYILAIDPAFAENDSSDFFAMTVLKKVSDKKFMVVHAYAVAGGKFKDHVNYFAYLYTFFNIKFIIMDNAGGSTFLQFINQDKRFKEKPFKVIEKPNFNDVNDYQKQLRLAREEYNLTERRIVLYQTFNSDWIRRSNEILQANMDHKRIVFASAAEFIESEFSRQRSLNIPIEKLKFIGLTKKEKVNSLDEDDIEGEGLDILDENLSPEMAKDAKKVDLIERQGFLISLMKTQCAFIEVKTSDSGNQSFVLPQNLKNQKGPDRPRRDLYTVLLLGSWANKCYNDFKTFVDDEDDEGDFVPTEIKK